VQRSIVDRSVTKITEVLRRDIYNLVHPRTLTHEITTPAIDNPLLCVGYSCAYWIRHVCEANRGDFQENRRSQLLKVLKQPFSVPTKSTHAGNSITAFLQHHFLHWLEALSLLGAQTDYSLLLD
jgi:hypothetical protein